MLRQLRLTQYKGFRSFTSYLGDQAVLMGPNNAGKSTMINAIRLCGAAMRVAMRVRPDDVFRDNGVMVRGYPLAMITDDGYNFSNIAFELQDRESRLDLTLHSGAVVHVVWPTADPAFFWVEHESAFVPSAAIAKRVLTRIGIVPTLTPLDSRERLLSPEHLRSHVETKLASRHFRNNLLAARADDLGQFEELVDYILTNTPEITSLEVDGGFIDGEYRLDVQYRDRQSALRKDVHWAGDGLQIWLQLLFHLWRTRGNRVILLDEPDVFLHPDLQRRLVRVVESTGRQTILASHSAEVAGEASISSLTWVDRQRRASKRLGDDHDLQVLSDALGTSFNLSMARALRAKIALFVEGEDMKVLRLLAATSGATWFAEETGLAIVPIGGFTHWPGVEAFGWLRDRFLGDQVQVRVVLDRDFRDQAEVDRLTQRLFDSGVTGHVWVRKELESYLLQPPTLARVSGLSESAVEDLAHRILTTLHDQTRATSIQIAVERRNRIGEQLARERAERRFDHLWADTGLRATLVPAKQFISSWNRMVRDEGGRVVSAVKLARAMKLEEMDGEMVQVLRDVEAALH